MAKSPEVKLAFKPCSMHGVRSVPRRPVLSMLLLAARPPSQLPREAVSARSCTPAARPSHQPSYQLGHTKAVLSKLSLTSCAASSRSHQPGRRLSRPRRGRGHQQGGAQRDTAPARAGAQARRRSEGIRHLRAVLHTPPAVSPAVLPDGPFRSCQWLISKPSSHQLGRLLEFSPVTAPPS